MTHRFLHVLAILALCVACKSPRRSGMQSVDAAASDASASEGDASQDSGSFSDAAIGSDGDVATVSHSACNNGLCPIKAGSFTLGAPRSEPFVAVSADIQVEVRLTHDFLIGESEITLAQWRAVGFPTPQPDWRRTGSKQADVPPPGYSTCDDPSCPALWINYEDAMAYANARSASEGLPACYQLEDCTGAPGRFLRCHSVRVTAASPYACEGYRLPTEAEWEYAARAGSLTAFFSGDISADMDLLVRCGLDPALDPIGWYCGNSSERPDGANGSGHAFKVMQKRANAWGLYDTAGNASEWVNDIMDPRGYGQGPFVDPVFGVADSSELTPKQHPAFGADYLDNEGYPSWRSSRGGMFDINSRSAKVDARLGTSAGAQHSGFRIARTLSASEKKSGKRP